MCGESMHMVTSGVLFPLIPNPFNINDNKEGEEDVDVGLHNRERGA